MWKTKAMTNLMRLVPNRLLYWCVITAWARATTQEYLDKSPDEVTCFMCCDFLDGKKKNGT